MILNKKIVTLFSMIIVLCWGSATMAANSSSAGNVIDDSVITTKIKTAMMADKSISSSNINVETNNGVVTLNGTVPTDKEATAAIETAQSTAGVKKINTSQLRVEKSDQPFSDTVITAKVKGLYTKEKVFGNEPVSIANIGVETKNGVVYLTGKATHAQARSAVKLAKSVDGVKSVKSRIKVS